MYISQDPIKLAGNNPTLYGYVKDVNNWIDCLGLETGKDIIDSIGPLNGRSKTDIEADLVNAGFSSTPANGGGTVWTKAGSDGTTAAIRIDPAKVRTPAKGFADEVPHAHKEIVPTSQVTSGNYHPSAATTLDDAGNVTLNRRDTHIPIDYH